jgi:hypothetical protein
MPSTNPNFDPIYAALASLLITSSIDFTATATAGSAVLMGIADTSELSAGLGVQGAGVPVGDFLQSVDSSTQVTLSQPVNESGTLSFNAGFTTTDPVAARLLRHWSVVDQLQQPALFLTQVNELSEKRPGQLAKWTLNTLVWVYAMAPDDTTPSAPALNTLLGLIRNALGPDKTGAGRAQFRQTLGGLVFDVWIEGAIVTDQGFLGQQAVAKIPIRIIQNGP